jgi:hypothetical protein
VEEAGGGVYGEVREGGGVGRSGRGVGGVCFPPPTGGGTDEVVVQVRVVASSSSAAPSLLLPKGGPNTQ